MPNELYKLRNQIDQIDTELLSILTERFRIATELAATKKKLHLPAKDLRRKEQVAERWREIAATKNLDSEFISQLYELIHDETLRKQS